MVGFVTVGPSRSSICLLPRIFRCQSRLLNVQLCRGCFFSIKGAEVGGRGCFNDRIKASFQWVLQQKARQNCALYHRLNARFGCCECSQACREQRCLALSCTRIPDWPALSVACVILSSVRPGKSLSRDRRPISS